MTTDFRALCAELTDCLEKADWPLRHRYVFRQWIDIARAALAGEPAVPEGREPASVTGQPSDQELLDIAASTIEPYECSGITTDEYEPETECAVEAYGSELIAFARAVLAHWGNPAPAPPADGEVAECTAELEEQKPRPDYDRVQKIATEAQIRSAAQYLAKKQHCDGDLIPAIRYAIARWGNPTLQPPADGEVVEVVEWLRTVVAAYKSCRNTDHIWSLSGNGVNARLTVTLLTRAADLLERQATACAICERERLHQSTRAADLEVERQAAPVPVPVNERLPEPEDCDAEGRCWIGYPEWTYSIADTGDTDATTPEWRLERPPLKPKGSRCYWLPAHALPPPEVGE